MSGLLSQLIFEKTVSIKHGGESHPYLPKDAIGTAVRFESRGFWPLQSGREENGS